uniref:Sushi domain-containing protein n=1 Tax=Panagrolaimus sp. PS1159 TaxID=55785 RepID=A0AC35GI07_9BILA
MKFLFLIPILFVTVESFRLKRQQPGSCPAIIPPLNGLIEYSTGTPALGQQYPHGATAQLICNTGIHNGSPTSSCINGVWTPVIGGCPGTPQSGIGGNAEGQQCASGTPQPGIGGNAEGQQCASGPLTPLNGQLRYSTGSFLGPYPSGSIVTLVCNPGFVSNGITEATCINGGFNPPILGECIGAGK